MRVRLIGLDHLMLISGGEVNSNEHAAAVLQEGAHIATRTGAAVNILAHSPKSASAKDEPDQIDILGAVATVNLARGATIVRRLRPAEAREFSIPEAERSRYARVLVVKSNSTPTGVEFTVRADYNADFEAVSLACVDLRKAKPGPDEKALAVLAVLARMGGQRSQPDRLEGLANEGRSGGLGSQSNIFYAR